MNVFAGYSYLNADMNGLTSRQSFNGFQVAPSFDVNRWFAVEGDFGGYYKSNVISAFGVGLDGHDYSFMAGPRINFGQGFAHALVGGDRLTGSALGLSASENGFASGFGGGFQSKPFAGHWAIRTSADYLMTRHSVVTQDTQNNIRVSAGIVYVFGPFTR